MLLLSSKEGKIYVLEDPDNSDDKFVIADLASRMCEDGERGLQSIRPHPNFKSNRYIYMFYSRSRDGCAESATDGPRNRLSRFTMNANTLKIDLSSERVLLETPPTLKHMHNGGNVAFGNDGKLWVTTGDGGSREPAVSQDLGHLHGKILRLNDDGSIPSNNPYANGGIRCGNNGGKTNNGVCGEIFARGLRNPFRLAMDPNVKSKVKFHVGDVGASAWEEISVGGSDYSKANYGWPPMEGPCERGDNRDCPKPSEFLDPFYYYEHSKGEEGGAVTGSVFVPDGLWPSQYKFLFIDFIFGRIYNLIKDEDRECRSCKPPVPGFRNETFHKLDSMVDMFFGPYKDTRALYIVSRSTTQQKIQRIRSTGSSNRSPVAKISVSDTTASLGQAITFDGSETYDPDGDFLTYRWDFGDGGDSSISKTRKAVHVYRKQGVFNVKFTVTDAKGQVDQSTISISVGKLPTAKMIDPPSGKQFFVGERMRLRGSAVDSSGNVLPSSQLFWEIRQHHATHWHPFLDRRAGNNFTAFPAPEPEDFNAAANSYLEVIMYAVDRRGLTTKISRMIKPQTRFVRVNSVPSGLEVLVDEFPVVTPKTITTWARHNLRFDIDDQPPYEFKSWSDGGNRRHTKKITATNSTLTTVTATFSKGSSAPPLQEPVRDCSSSRPCGRCEGDCDTDADCMGDLVCFDKGGRNKPVPGCSGIDASLTDWCTIASAPRLKEPVRDCSSSSPCGRCEGHCDRDADCVGALVCYDKGGRNKPVRGCTGIDGSLTKWCTIA
ncbi:Glucose Sorbosone dehydrogenase [Fragilaria crotonensis]|nr:Glucose Sorbosone dehydrogenase [Fragilaria crotonensis]